jgi:hypothetical protein
MIRDAQFRRDNTSSLDKNKEFVDGWTLTNLLYVVKFMASMCILNYLNWILKMAKNFNNGKIVVEKYWD